MLLGIKSKTAVFYRHVTVAAVAVILMYIVWVVNSTWSSGIINPATGLLLDFKDWSVGMREWKAPGGAAFALLWFVVFIGPASRLWKPLKRLVTWRREVGIWFFVVGFLHGFLIVDGWARWDALSFLGYKYIPQLETYLRSEPGFGLANLMGLLALVFALALAATSFDKVVSFLGMSSWKWLHTFAYVIFYLLALHVVYFAFIHYTPSPERVLLGQPTNYPANPLRFYYLTAMLSVFVFQTAAFIKTVRQHRKSGR